MIQLTQDQVRALGQAGKQPATAIDPETQTAYILLRKDDYERLVAEYDDSSWTDQERDALAAEVDAMLEDDMAIEDAP